MQANEWWKTTLQPSLRLLIGETGKPTKLSLIRAAAVSSEPEGKFSG
jgi:hypothetical protein